jgi:hypothetical protein
MRPNFGVRNTTFENLFLSPRTPPLFRNPVCELALPNFRSPNSASKRHPLTSAAKGAGMGRGTGTPFPLAGSDTDKKHTFACKMHTIKLIAKLTSTETCRRNDFHALRHISFNFCFNSPPWTPTHPASHPPTSKTTKESMRCCNARAVGMARRGE